MNTRENVKRYTPKNPKDDTPLVEGRQKYITMVTQYPFHVVFRLLWYFSVFKASIIY